jgi:hypothetical protein
MEEEDARRKTWDDALSFHGSQAIPAATRQATEDQAVGDS